MGHYASEMGFGPSQAEIDLDRRLTRMQELLGRLPMTRFTADFAYDIGLVMGPRPDYTWHRDRALERLEAFLVADIKADSRGGG